MVAGFGGAHLERRAPRDPGAELERRMSSRPGTYRTAAAACSFTLVPHVVVNFLQYLHDASVFDIIHHTLD